MQDPVVISMCTGSASSFGPAARGRGCYGCSTRASAANSVLAPHTMCRLPKHGRLWLNDGSYVRLRPHYRGHVWSYDFVADRTHDGLAFRMVTVIEEHSRKCLAIHVQRQLKSDDVLAVPTDLFVKHGPPA